MWLLRSKLSRDNLHNKHSSHCLVYCLDRVWHVTYTSIARIHRKHCSVSYVLGSMIEYNTQYVQSCRISNSKVAFRNAGGEGAILEKKKVSGRDTCTSESSK